MTDPRIEAAAKAMGDAERAHGGAGWENSGPQPRAVWRRRAAVAVNAADEADPDRLFRAFTAGFRASAVDFNGEYIGSMYRDDAALFDARVRDSFERWCRRLEREGQ